LHLSSLEEARVKENIVNATATLAKAETKAVQGTTKAELLKFKEQVAPMGTSSLEMAGAYDNYYNHDTSTGWFRVQSLGFVGHYYIRIEGSTLGSSKNASSMATYKGYINNYDTYVNAYMLAPTWPEVVGWGTALAGLATIVAGYGTGPVEWVTIALYYGGALSTFAGITSTAYSTYSRLQPSKTAAQYLENARNMNYYGGGSYWENQTAITSVLGF
jgi:hypothetical protein